jgi:two-component system, OmpR family, alkaline phosphatase synthesis response regulator PhoP
MFAASTALPQEVTMPDRWKPDAGRILVLEEDEVQATRLVADLEMDGYEVECRASGLLGLECALASSADLVLLELSLSDLDGFRVLGCLRRRGCRVPVIVLSDRDHPSDKVLSLRMGADDFVTKPYEAMELLARVGALLRRTRGRWSSSLDAPQGNNRLSSRPIRSDSSVLNGMRGGAGPKDSDPAPGSESAVTSFGDIQVDPSAHVVRKGGDVVDLTPKETGLLLAMARRRGAVASYGTLLREVWGTEAPDSSRTVNTHMFQLRQKLEDNPSKPRHFLTVRKVGYRLRVG